MASLPLKTPCQALVVRFAPTARIGESLNIGVVVVCAARGFAQARFISSTSRITGAFRNTDPVILRRIGNAFDDACGDAMSRLRGLAPLDDIQAFARTVVQSDDSTIQFSAVISGLTQEPRRTLDELFEQYVAAAMAEKRRSREDAAIWRAFAQRVPDDVQAHLVSRTIKTQNYKLRLDHTWRNGILKAAVPISLDLLEPDSIREKATGWSGKLLTIRPWERDMKVFLLIGAPPAASSKALRQASADAHAILEQNLREHSDSVSGVDEAEAEPLLEEIVRDVRARSADDSSS